METSSEKEYSEKEKVYYTSTLNMWYTIRLEKDKQLLALSVTALGVLVTLLRTVGASNVCQAVFFSIAIVGFFFTIILMLCSLEESSVYLKQILIKSSVDESKFSVDESKLKFLDETALLCFGIAMLFVLLIGVSCLVDDLHREKKVTQESQKPQIQRMINVGEVQKMIDVGEKQTHGMQGAASLKPQPPSKPQNNPSPPQGLSVGGSTNQGNEGSGSNTSAT